jgi:hypothetical protein
MVSKFLKIWVGNSRSGIQKKTLRIPENIKSEGTQMSEGRDTDKRFIIVHSFSFLFRFKLFHAKQSYIPYLKCRNIP